MSLSLPQTERRILTVAEITNDIKNLVEDNFPSVWLRGEISNFKAYGSGHHYFTLKDSESQLSAVMFRGFNRHLKFQPEDGMSVIVHGRLTVYEVRGNYQILVDYMEPDGVGALQMAFEQLKKKLSGEGLFDATRKRKLPFLPTTVGLVTSMHGAAVHDMLSVLRRRFANLNILIYPVKVQGEGAKEEITAAIDYFSQTRAADVVIVGRGGGSIEDLWAFNEEVVARAVARSAVPIVSAIGHETDYTICDFVADLRAPTPSAAAELCVPRKADLLYTIGGLRGRLIQAWRHCIVSLEQHLERMRRRLPSPLVLWDRSRLRLADLEDRLSQNMILLLRRWGYELTEARLRITDPAMQIREWRQKVVHLKDKLHHVQDKILTAYKNDYERFKIKLTLLSPQNILERGYLIGKRKNGDVVTRAKDLKVDDLLDIVFYDGVAEVQVTKRSQTKETKT